MSEFAHNKKLTIFFSETPPEFDGVDGGTNKKMACACLARSNDLYMAGSSLPRWNEVEHARIT